MQVHICQKYVSNFAGLMAAYALANSAEIHFPIEISVFLVSKSTCVE